TGRYRLPPERSSEKANSCFDPAPLIRFGQKAFIFTQAFHEREIALRRQRRQIRHAMTGKPPHPIAASGGFRQQFHHRRYIEMRKAVQAGIKKAAVDIPTIDREQRLAPGSWETTVNRYPTERLKIFPLHPFKIRIGHNEIGGNAGGASVTVAKLRKQISKPNDVVFTLESVEIPWRGSDCDARGLQLLHGPKRGQADTAPIVALDNDDWSHGCYCMYPTPCRDRLSRVPPKSCIHDRKNLVTRRR